MGVYIKDMEMPDCCAECSFCYPSGGHFCHCIEEVYIPYDVFIEGRPDWCPLVEVEDKCRACYDDCLPVVVPKEKWIWCEDSLPNEDEIAYTTMVDVSGERDISDKVLVCDIDLNIYAAYFIHTGTPHKYYGTCLTNEYTLMHSHIGQAGWQCTENKYGWSKRIDAIAWMPLPKPYQEDK